MTLLALRTMQTTPMIAAMLALPFTLHTPLASAQAASASAGQAWPTKPIRLIVNFPPGGTTDLMARAFSPKLAETLGQPVIIDNRGGAAGNIGLEVAAKAPADGYTILASSGSPIVVGPHFYKLSVNVDRDLAPIAPMARILTLLVVKPGLPVKSVAELTAYLRVNQNKLNYGSVGTGSTLHIHAERYLFVNKIRATHVPYKGAALMVTALLSDQVDFAFDSGLSVQHVRSGKLRAYMVTANARQNAAPEVPSADEAGMPGLYTSVWHAIWVPAKTPREIIAKLNQAVVKGLLNAEMRERLLAQGIEPVGNSPAEFTQLMREELPKWGKIAKISGAKLD